MHIRGENCNRCCEQIKINEDDGSLFTNEVHGIFFLNAVQGMRWSVLSEDAEATRTSTELFESC